MALGTSETKFGAATYWDLSTGHVTQSDMELLESLDLCSGAGRPGGPPLHVYAYDEGCFLSYGDLIDEEEDIERFGFSEAFRHILRTALENGVYLIRFDADGNQVEEFPHNGW